MIAYHAQNESVRGYAHGKWMTVANPGAACPPVVPGPEPAPEIRLTDA